MTKVPICQEWSKRIPRQSDGDALYLPCTGGVRCARRQTDVWHIEPIFDGDGPSAKGFMATRQLQDFLRQNGLKPIAFHRIGWYRGVYHSGWSPIIPGRTRHMEGAADLWRHVTANLSSDRTTSELGAMTNPTHEKIARLLDDKSEEERLSHSISLSLRNMDIAVEQVAEFYNEKLVNLMAAKHLNGNRSGSALDHMLYAHVHSFFMHLGAERDYLGALIALRIGKDPHVTDSMGKLMSALRTSDFARDTLLTLLNRKGYLQNKPTTANKVEAAGWLRDVTDLRNEFMHRRPYGAKFVEKMGYAKAIDESAGLYRYVRPLLRSDGTEHDVLDFMAEHYSITSALFFECAKSSGYNTAMITLTDDDLISVEIDKD